MSSGNPSVSDESKGTTHMTRLLAEGCESGVVPIEGKGWMCQPLLENDLGNVLSRPSFIQSKQSYLVLQLFEEAAARNERLVRR